MGLFNILMEMAFERKKALDKIDSVSDRLSEKMVLLHHCDKSSDNIPHWKNTINSHISTIFRASFLKNNKRVSRTDLIELIVDQYSGEYDDYLRNYAAVRSEKLETSFTEASYDDYKEIKNHLIKLVDLILKNSIYSPKYEDLV